MTNDAISDAPPVKPKLSREQTQVRKAARLQSIRLQMAIYRALYDRGITTPADIGEALGLSAAEAATLLTRKHLREGDLARLEAAAGRLGLLIMPLILLPTSPEPVRNVPSRAELGNIWDALDQDGRRLLLAQARAVADVTGRHHQRSDAQA